MAYRSLQECINDLQRTGQLVRIDQEIDPHLEAAEIQRRVYQAGGPAIYYARVRGCTFPMVSNLFGTRQRTHFIFRHTLAAVQSLVQMKLDPAAVARAPWRYLRGLRALPHLLPRRAFRAPVLEQRTSLSQLPQLKSWPDDGGAFITLPQVYTEDPDHPGPMRSNLGMYRVQLSGGAYQANREVGLHYQIHRGIGVHHAAAIRRGERLPVNIFVGGPPSLTVAAVMPLPEGLSELMFAGALGGRSIRLVRRAGKPALAADADFCISGWIDPQRQLPEGPFGDHLGYYSLAHDFPVMEVRGVYHRRDAVWPFTTVGRPPQEDTSFGELIHEITGPIIPSVIPGVRGVNAVDAAGVHPLLLAIGSERYTPYAQRRRPQELLTQSNAILGQGQMSLAKYLLITAHEDDPALDVNDIASFFRHLLARVDWQRDVHFQTCTTIDTLDYSGTGFNEGSKVVWAACGPPRRELPTELPPGLPLPAGFEQPRLCLPGVVAVRGPAYSSSIGAPDTSVRRFCEELSGDTIWPRYPLVVIVDDSDFTSATLNNFLWVTFTRSNPASDIDGLGATTINKHWGCTGSLVIDARIKPHHAPPLVEDPQITRRIDALAAPGGPLHGII